jgi:HSP20 family protein
MAHKYVAVHCLQYPYQTNNNSKRMYNTRNYAVNPRTLGSLIEGAFHNGWNHFNEEVSAHTAPVNIQETDTSYEVHVIAAGLKKEDFKISTDRNTLTISAEHKEEPKAETTEQKDAQPQAKWLRKEYKMKSFKRSFTLNEKIDTGKITAKYADGILVVSLPKKENREPVAQEIAVN